MWEQLLLMQMVWEMGVWCCFVIEGPCTAQRFSSELHLVYLLWAAVILTSLPSPPHPPSPFVSWKVLPGILQKHCCILPDKNTGKGQTDVPLCPKHTSHTNTQWDRKEKSQSVEVMSGWWCWGMDAQWVSNICLSTCFCVCSDHL